MNAPARTHYKELIPTDWLGQWDFKKSEYTLEIASIERYTPERKNKKKDPKTGKWIEVPPKRLVVRFKGAQKGWLAGRVSQDILAKMYGPYVEEWIGKKVTLYVDASVEMGGEVVGGIRPRPRIPRGPTSQDAPDGPENPAAAAEKLQQIERAREQAEGGGETTRTREPGEEG